MGLKSLHKKIEFEIITTKYYCTNYQIFSKVSYSSNAVVKVDRGQLNLPSSNAIVFYFFLWLGFVGKGVWLATVVVPLFQRYPE